ncbi:phosphatase PAP2 family protein [Pendulispora brunnea]|uniref:Phosphatase PAP2 family protein n=1 Tax=Pendulispora brunnea TaxID=2905690 RepID=A0ABZ2JVB8_9BACT
MSTPTGKSKRCAAAAAVMFLAHAVARPAAAQSEPRVDLSAAPDTAIIAGALAGTWLVSQIPVERRRWTSELLPFDGATRGTFSKTHAIISDFLLAGTIMTPMFANLLTRDPDALPKTIVTGEALSLCIFLNALSKYSVQRPRPYTYATDREILGFAASRRGEAYLSFYSSHSTNAFAAAVSGGLLFGYGNSDTELRAVVWGVEMALASATATERVRAGQHFPSDVLLGAVVGTAIGILVPRAHMRDRAALTVHPIEWAAIGSGLVFGTTVAAVLPSFHWPAYDTRTLTVRLMPSFSTTGASLVARGAF